MMLARSAQTGIKIHISVKTRLSPRTKFFIESNMSKCLSFRTLTQPIRLFVTILTAAMSCLNNTFKGSLQNLQLPLLGSCMAPVVEPLSTTPGGKSIAVRISVIGNAVQIPTLPLIRKKNLQLLRPIMSLIKSLWAIRNSHSVFQFSSASNAADDEEYQYYRDRALAYAGTTPTGLTCKPALATVT